MVAALLGAIAVSAILLVVVTGPCPSEGFAFSESRRSVHRLKNRTSLPQETNFNRNLNLELLLQPGDDRSRWSHEQAAKLEGYVVSVGRAGVELANCYVGRDTHINIALRPAAPMREQMVLEVTPPMREWARSRGWDWSDEKLKGLVGHWCSFEGWLFFDLTHAGESENIAPGRPDNWRGTAWEIHPVTKIELLK